MKPTDLEKIKHIFKFAKEHREVNLIFIIISGAFFLPDFIRHVSNQDLSRLIVDWLLWVVFSFLMTGAYAANWLRLSQENKEAKALGAISFVYVNDVAIGEIPTYQYLRFKQDALTDVSVMFLKPFFSLIMSFMRFLSALILCYFVVYISVDNSSILLTPEMVIDSIDKNFLATFLFVSVAFKVVMGDLTYYYNEAVGNALRLHFKCVALGDVVVFDKNPMVAVHGQN